MIDPRRSPAPAIILILFLLIPPMLYAQEVRSVRYYVSNDLGMALEEIGQHQQEEFPYILVVESEGKLVTRTLYHRGEALRRWEIGPTEERNYRGAVLEQKRRFDDSGRLLEEQIFQEGSLSERTVYYYNRETLDRTETFGPEGELLHSDEYWLSPDGQLRRVTRDQGDRQADQRLALSGGSRGILEERYGNARETRINRYDKNGRLVEQEYWYEGRLSERESFQYRGDSDLPLSFLLEELPQERTTLRTYDQEGRLVRIEVTDHGRESEQTVHVRDAQGRIVETTTRGSRGIENWLFQYGPDDDLVREEYRVRGSLERVTLYSVQDQVSTRLEELYREEQIFMRIYYEAERKVKEEFLRNGEVVRVREYP
ncbi:MAG: hypothetical protein JSV89_04305 [Spirochaetaceae bacterium]|nr:MAG: hypothetical protein JSV89_04305 [Spirochaetaceae bacterium]